MTSSNPEVQSKYVEVNGITLHYKQWSDAGPPLIFLHGGTGSHRIWDLIAPNFTSGYSVMAFDLRGHGLSSNPERGYGIDDYSADLLEFIGTYTTDEVTLVGTSLGALVCVYIAMRVSERIRAVVLQDPPFTLVNDAEALRARFEPALQIKRLPIDQRVERIMEVTGRDRESAMNRAELLDEMSEGVLLEAFEGRGEFRVDDWLPTISCPTLLILGSPERRGVVPYELRPKLKRLMKNMTLVQWDDVGHSPHMEQPERFVAEVQNFLASVADTHPSTRSATVLKVKRCWDAGAL